MIIIGSLKYKKKNQNYNYKHHSCSQYEISNWLRVSKLAADLKLTTDLKLTADLKQTAATPLSPLYVSQCSHTIITTICLSVQLHHYHYYMSPSAATPLSLLYVSQCSYTTITTITIYLQGIDRASFSFIKYVQISNLFQIFQHVPPTHMILLNLSSYIQSYSYYQTQGWMLQRDWNIVTFYLNANKIERI